MTFSCCLLINHVFIAVDVGREGLRKRAFQQRFLQQRRWQQHALLKQQRLGRVCRQLCGLRWWWSLDCAAIWEQGQEEQQNCRSVVETCGSLARKELWEGSGAACMPRHSTLRGCARLTAASKLAALSNYREWLILALMCQLLLLMEVYTGIIARPESRETVTVLPVPPMEAPVQ